MIRLGRDSVILAVNGAADVFVWSLVLLLGLVLLFIVVVVVKRWMRHEEQPTPGGFTMSDLREMRRSGQISQEEFERTRAQLVQEARKQVEPPAEDNPPQRQQQ